MVEEEQTVKTGCEDRWGAEVGQDVKREVFTQAHVRILYEFTRFLGVRARYNIFYRNYSLFSFNGGLSLVNFFSE